MEMKWGVEIVQGNKVLNEESNVINLERKPFIIKVRLQTPHVVRLNVLDNNSNFQKINPNLPMDFKKATGFPSFHCFIAGTGWAEENFNEDESLNIDAEGHHYLYYDGRDDHRWSNVEISPEKAVFERKVSRLYIGNRLESIEQFSGQRLYLIFLVKFLNQNPISSDELKKIILSFKPNRLGFF